jgi:WhiB family redox-sensing transcriptional regulator
MVASTAGALTEPAFLHIGDLLGHPDAPDQRWRARARCRGADPRIFMPPRGGDISVARSYCARCSVRLPCLEYAMSLGDALCHGIWGSATARDRHRARRRGWDARRLLAHLDG